jgi:hypothetical protein
MTNDHRTDPECGGTIASDGGNVVADRTCFLTPGPDDVLDIDPRLLPLASNGGATQTHAPTLGSPAIDRLVFDPARCLSLDQRGFARPVNAGGGPRCDSGAVEVQNRPCEPRPPVAVTVTPAGDGRVNVSLHPTLNQGTTTNGLRRVQFGPTTRATLDLGALGFSRGNVTVTVPGTGTFGFVVIPDAPGLATLAPFVAFDDCGGWPSFAGTGPSVNGGPGSSSVGAGADPVPAGRVAPAPVVAAGSPAGAAPAASVTAPPAATGAASSKPHDDDEPRRRSNRQSRDDTHIEGDVVAVDVGARPPTITIASRDGEVTLRLRDDAREQAEGVRVGDYVEARGEKVHEGLYDVDGLDVEERASR